MRKEKFTKGPWKKDKRYEDLTGVDGTSVVLWGAGLSHGGRSEETEANSKLIAVAPEMYDMLIECRRLMFIVAGTSKETLQIDELLAKARGEIEAFKI